MTGVRFQYTGQIAIPEAGLRGLSPAHWADGPARYYYKARFYAPSIGRFLQPDPIGYTDGPNIYAYVGNDPINATDPSGLAANAGGPGPCIGAAIVNNCVTEGVYTGGGEGAGFNFAEAYRNEQIYNSVFNRQDGLRDLIDRALGPDDGSSGGVRAVSMGIFDDDLLRIRLALGQRTVTEKPRPLIPEDFGFDISRHFSVVSGTIVLNGTSLDIRINFLQSRFNKIPFIRSVNGLIKTAQVHDATVITINATFANEKLLTFLQKNLNGRITTQGPNEIIVILVPYGGAF